MKQQLYLFLILLVVFVNRRAVFFVDAGTIIGTRNLVNLRCVHVR